MSRVSLEVLVGRTSQGRHLLHLLLGYRTNFHLLIRNLGFTGLLPLTYDLYWPVDFIYLYLIIH
jgi:hypothetical protein